MTSRQFAATYDRSKFYELSSNNERAILMFVDFDGADKTNGFPRYFMVACRGAVELNDGTEMEERWNTIEMLLLPYYKETEDGDVEPELTDDYMLYIRVNGGFYWVPCSADNYESVFKGLREHHGLSRLDNPIRFKFFKPLVNSLYKKAHPEQVVDDTGFDDPLSCREFHVQSIEHYDLYGTRDYLRGSLRELAIDGNYPPSWNLNLFEEPQEEEPQEEQKKKRNTKKKKKKKKEEEVEAVPELEGFDDIYDEALGLADVIKVPEYPERNFEHGISEFLAGFLKIDPRAEFKDLKEKRYDRYGYRLTSRTDEIEAEMIEHVKNAKKKAAKEGVKDGRCVICFDEYEHDHFIGCSLCGDEIGESCWTELYSLIPENVRGQLLEHKLCNDCTTLVSPRAMQRFIADTVEEAQEEALIKQFRSKTGTTDLIIEEAKRIIPEIEARLDELQGKKLKTEADLREIQLLLEDLEANVSMAKAAPNPVFVVDENKNRLMDYISSVECTAYYYMKACRERDDVLSDVNYLAFDSDTLSVKGEGTTKKGGLVNTNKRQRVVATGDRSDDEEGESDDDDDNDEEDYSVMLFRESVMYALKARDIVESHVRDVQELVERSGHSDDDIVKGLASIREFVEDIALCMKSNAKILTARVQFEHLCANEMEKSVMDIRIGEMKLVSRKMDRHCKYLIQEIMRILKQNKDRHSPRLLDGEIKAWGSLQSNL